MEKENKKNVDVPDYEAGRLKMVDVKCFLAALKITKQKRILSNDGKITKILNALYLAVKLIKDRGGEFANILMLRANNCFAVDVFKHYRTGIFVNINVLRFPFMICSRVSTL